ncbi:MAG: VWA domain-containing protein [Bacteroidota bacterium]
MQPSIPFLARLRAFAMILTTLLLATACNKNDNAGPSDPVKGLNIIIQDQYESLPSRVSIFFKVQDNRGNPIAGLTEENFTIYEKGRNDDKERILSEDEATRVLSDNRVVFRFHTVLLLDLSASVLNGSLDQLKAGARKFVGDILDQENNTSADVGIWYFDGQDKIHSLVNFTNDKQVLENAIDRIQPNISSDSSTDLFGAIIKSVRLAENKLGENQLQEILSAASIVVFTDGTDQAARYAKQEAYDAVDKAPEDIYFYTIGLGNEIDTKVLERIGKTSSVYASDTEALTAKFQEIATVITAEADSYYLFEYCTPKRDGSGVNELHLFLEAQGGRGRRITTFDATGFEADCDLD